MSTGASLEVNRQALEEVRAKGRPVGGDTEFTITHAGYDAGLQIVSVRAEVTERSWWLDPETLEPTSPPKVRNYVQTYTLVIEDGKWKVRNIAEE